VSAIYGQVNDGGYATGFNFDPSDGVCYGTIDIWYGHPGFTSSYKAVIVKETRHLTTDELIARAKLITDALNAGAYPTYTKASK
jgi:hypothetical protein